MKKLIVALIAAMLLLCHTALSAQNPPIIDEALLHLGKSYRYATAGPTTFDCSGFVYYCYDLIEDIQLKRSAKDQGYDDTYKKINDIDELIAGDVVFFNTVKGDGDACDHSGLYLGEGNFIHCSSGRGKVIISTLMEGYYHERFSWGRRILQEAEYEYTN